MRFVVLLVGCSFAAWAQSAAPPTAAEIRTIAEKGYVFAYPMVLMEKTRGDAGTPNILRNAAVFPNARFRQVIRPNADTLYSTAWIDLSREPVLLHVPDTHGRFYLMQFLDMWTDTFAVPGKRTTGDGEGWFALVGPGWKGKLPERAKRIDAPTSSVWLIGRTQTNNPSDYPNVRAIQKGYLLMPLNSYPDGWGGDPPIPPPPPPKPVTPPQQVAGLTGAEFFRTFASLLAANPPHSGDEAMMRDLARLGIAPGRDFDPAALGGDGMRALEEGAEAAAKQLEGYAQRPAVPGKTGWSGFGGFKIGRYGSDYAVRAIVARIGLGALPPEDAVYLNCAVDSSGRPFDSAARYRMHFEKDEIPPVRAFWSVTMYDAAGYFAENPINRFAIGDRDRLKFNTDGSLDIYIQHAAPGGERDANWLPAPEGGFNLSLRLYWPKDEILKRAWIPPAVQREP